uniref:CCHC-type domain-containing protein n=1 Tax=Strigamia maritima TaxID=126957 RepID=T1ITL3_STRMM
MHRKGSKQQPTSPSSQQNASQSSSSKPNSESLVCFNCGGPGHYARDCTAPKLPRGGREGVAEDVAKQVKEDNDQCKHHQRANCPSKCELKPLRLELGEGSSIITGHGTIEISAVVNDAVSVIELKNVYYLKGDSPLDISNGSETHSFNPNESSDDSDNDSSSPVPVKVPIIPPAAPLITQAPSGVTTRKKPTQLVPIPPFKHRSKVERAPVPGKSGWICEQVQRQSDATAGQWDVYFYPPGQQVKLRSRPEVRSYCENELNEPYVAADYDWKPSQKPVDTVVQEPSTEQAVVEPQGATDESDNNDHLLVFAQAVPIVTGSPWDILRMSVINLDVHSHPESYFM